MPKPRSSQASPEATYTRLLLLQREKDDWYVNTVMVENCNTPFKFKRQLPYNNLQGARVNMTYYQAIEMVAGIVMEVMKVVRIKLS